MKITNDDLRLIAVYESPYGQVDDADVAAELLQRRAEVRRLRSVLRDLDWRLLNPPQVDLAREKIAAALAPKRKRRAKR